MSVWELLASMVDRPAKALAHVNDRRWLWLAPAVILVVGIVIHNVATAPANATIAAREIQRQMLDLPPEQAEMVSQQVETFSSPLFIGGMGIGTGIVGLAIAWLLAAGTLYFLGLVAGGDVDFGLTFALVAWSWLPFFLRGLTQMAYVLYTNSPLFNQGLAFLVSSGEPTQDAANWLYLALAQVDLFSLWHVVLVFVGLTALARFSRSKAATVTAGYIVLSLAFRLIPAFISQAFM